MDLTSDLDHDDVSASPPTEDGSTTRFVPALTLKQERRLVEYLEERFLFVMRDYKKRSQQSSSLQTLLSYLDATHPIFSLIMQIPPVDPSGSLRITLLLRLTGDILSSITGYQPDSPGLEALLAWLSDLDSGWVAILRRQGWDSLTSQAYDVTLPEGGTSRVVSTTERARLRSLILGGTEALEEWLVKSGGGGVDFDEALERMGLEQGIGDVFMNTMAEMGALGGVGVTVDKTSTRPEGMGNPDFNM